MAFAQRFLVLLALFGGALSAFVPSSSRCSLRSTTLWGTTSSVAESATFRREAVTMMPATLEKEAVRTRGPAVLDHPEVERRRKTDEPAKERKTGNEVWEVRIYNDGMNTREHVARSLVQVTGMAELDAYQTMMQAHQNGIAVVGRWVYEVAEMYHDALKKNGIVCDLVPVDEDV